MNIQQLKYFIEIADTNNLSAAARNLFVTQPTLSLALKKLENELETCLFSHDEQAYQLTDSGLYLYEKGSAIVQEFDQLAVDIHEMNTQQQTQTIILGITTLFTVQFMKEITLFLDKHPHVNLVIKQNGSAHLQKQLLQGKLDIGLLSYPNLYTGNLKFEPLETTTRGYHVYVVLPHTNPLATKSELTFTDLKGQRFSSLSDKFMLGKLLIDRSRAFGFTPNIIMYNDDLQVLVHSLTKNNSIAILPVEYREVGKSDGLVWVPLKDKYDFFPIGIALQKDNIPSSDITDFIELIKHN